MLLPITTSKKKLNESVDDKESDDSDSIQDVTLEYQRTKQELTQDLIDHAQEVYHSDDSSYSHDKKCSKKTNKKSHTNEIKKGNKIQTTKVRSQRRR